MVRLPRGRLGGPDQQPGAVVHEGQVADQRDRPPAGRSWASAAPMAVDTVPSIPATPRLDRTLNRGVESDQGNVAHRVGRAEHQLVTVTQPVGDGSGHVQSRGQRVRLELAAHRRDACRVSPRRTGAARPGSGVPVVTARVPVACELPDTSGQRGPVVSAKTGTDGSASSADTGRCSVGRPSMITCCGCSSDNANGCSGFAAGAPWARRRSAVRQVGVHPRAVTGDDDGVGGEVDVQRLVEGDRRGVGPGPAVGAARRERGVAYRRVGHQRLAQRDVELHRTRIGGTGTLGRHQYSTSRRPPLGVERGHGRAISASPRLMLARTWLPK